MTIAQHALGLNSGKCGKYSFLGKLLFHESGIQSCLHYTLSEIFSLLSCSIFTVLLTGFSSR